MNALSLKHAWSLAAPALVVAASLSVALHPPSDAQTMARAAASFLASLDAEQRAAAVFPYEGDERLTWHFVPGDYPGARWGDLDARQERAARALLASALSARGVAQVEGARALDQVLRELESRPGREATHRDPGRYYLAVFGDPAGANPWGWRLEGHHVSIHFSSVSGAVAATPFFLGSAPARSEHEAYRGRLLGLEIAQALALVSLLDDEQLASATLPFDRPRDVILGPGRDTHFDEAVGLSARDMTATQREALQALLAIYFDRLAPEVAARYSVRYADELAGLRFAWLGELSADGPHYYRVHGKSFAIEYATQAGQPNHVHTVWRDLAGDFGRDLLRDHYEREHR